MVPGTWYTQDWSTPINEAGNRQWATPGAHLKTFFSYKNMRKSSSAIGHSCLAENAHVGTLKEVAEVESDELQIVVQIAQIGTVHVQMLRKGRSSIQLV